MADRLTLVTVVRSPLTNSSTSSLRSRSAIGTVVKQLCTNHGISFQNFSTKFATNLEAIAVSAADFVDSWSVLEARNNSDSELSRRSLIFEQKTAHRFDQSVPNTASRLGDFEKNGAAFETGTLSNAGNFRLVNSVTSQRLSDMQFSRSSLVRANRISASPNFVEPRRYLSTSRSGSASIREKLAEKLPKIPYKGYAPKDHGLPAKPFPGPPDITSSKFAHAKIHLRLRRIRLAHNHHRKEETKSLAMIFRLYEEAAYYGLGFRLYWTDVRIAALSLADCIVNFHVTSGDVKQLSRTLADTVRLGPFIILALAPFAYLLIPVYLRFFPTLLPTTFNEIYQPDEAAKELTVYTSHYYDQLKIFAKEYCLSNDLLYVLNHGIADNLESVSKVAETLVQFMAEHGMTVPQRLAKVRESLRHIEGCRDHLYD